MKPTYRDEFANEDEAASYDRQQYGVESWSSLLWTMEQKMLAGLMTDSSFVPNRMNYLDFACGTGRVLGFLSPRFNKSTGLDISAAMLGRARERVPSANYVCANVVSDDYDTNKDVDLITAFRFVLNADSTDRGTALRWMRLQLRDQSSRVIVNNHSNLWTHKALPYAVRRRRNHGHSITGNVLSHRQLSRDFTNAGFSVEGVHGTGFFGGSALSIVPYDTMSNLQRHLTDLSIFGRFGEDQIYVLSPNG